MDLAVADDVVDVAPQQRVCVQCDVEPGQIIEVLAGVEIDSAERALGRACAGVSELNVAGVIVHLVMLAGTQPAHDFGHPEVGRALVGRAREHERHPCLVDEDRVGLVDQNHVGVRHEEIGRRGGEPVAEHVETDLADRRVGDLRRVRAPPFRWRGRLTDAADRDAEQVVDGAHPLGVPAGQVVVDRDHMHRPASPRVSGCRECAGQCLPLAGGHLGDVPGQHDERAEQLYVVRTLTERPVGSLPPDGAERGVVRSVTGQAGQFIVGDIAQRVLTGGDRREQALILGEVGGPGFLQEPADPLAESAHGTRLARVAMLARVAWAARAAWAARVAWPARVAMLAQIARVIGTASVVRAARVNATWCQRCALTVRFPPSRPGQYLAKRFVL